MAVATRTSSGSARGADVPGVVAEDEVVEGVDGGLEGAGGVVVGG
jgi:hypothetical protein